jgi:hypothetical protein
MFDWETIGRGLTKEERAAMRLERLAFEIEERAAIKEFCGNMPRAQAEAEAKAEVMALHNPYNKVKKG